MLAHDFNECEECELGFLMQLFYLHDCSVANPKLEINMSLIKGVE